jgi:hypothetical protein
MEKFCLSQFQSRGHVYFRFTNFQIFSQFILEARARKYHPNKELCKKHGVLEISLLAEKVCTI